MTEPGLYHAGNRALQDEFASLSRDDDLLARTVGAQMIVRVAVRAIFPNCPRYIPQLNLVEASLYAPAPGVAPPEPAWKGFDAFKDVVPPRMPAWDGSEP